METFLDKQRELAMAPRDRDVLETIGQAQAVLADLHEWHSVSGAQLSMVSAQNAVREAKSLDLPRAREQVAEAEAEAMMDAYAEGAIDGKNAEQRKTQTDAWLARHEGVLAARDACRAVEARVVDLEAEAAVAEAEYKAALAKWNSAQAAAGLLSAMLRALAGIE